MDEIEILKFKLETIAETLRLVHNNYDCSSKDTCLKRMVCQSWDYAKEALAAKPASGKDVVINGIYYTRAQFNKLADQFEQNGGV